MLVVVDTHAWIWAVDGDTRRLGRRARALLAKAAARDGVRVSPASVFEVAALHTAGRLRLARPVADWTREALAVPGVRVAELTSDVAVDAGSIPRDALADPIDRLLVASARQLAATLLTADERILGYAKRTTNVRAQNAAA